MQLLYQKGYEDDILSRHNEFRAAHGVPALTWDPKVEIKKEKSRLAKFTTIYIH